MRRTQARGGSNSTSGGGLAVVVSGSFESLGGDAGAVVGEVLLMLYVNKAVKQQLQYEYDTEKGRAQGRLDAPNNAESIRPVSR